MAKQISEHFKIRTVSDGRAWGWGPTRTKSRVGVGPYAD
jgi:hypothetical protein